MKYAKQIAASLAFKLGADLVSNAEGQPHLTHEEFYRYLAVGRSAVIIASTIGTWGSYGVYLGAEREVFGNAQLHTVISLSAG